MSEHRVIERLLSRCTPVPETGCWLWLDAVNEHGYAITRHDGRTVLAHRVIAGIVVEPPSVVTRHSCDVRSCLAPGHVKAGTVLENVQDMHARGRARKATGSEHPRRRHPELWPSGDRHWTRQHPERALRGDRNGRAKLTQEQATEIRARASPGRGRGPGAQANSFRALAREFGIDRRTVAQIAKGETWRI